MTLTEKLLAYSIGRGIESYDMPAIRKIARESATTDYRWSSLVLGIVRSTPFSMGIVSNAKTQTAAQNRPNPLPPGEAGRRPGEGKRPKSLLEPSK